MKLQILLWIAAIAAALLAPMASAQKDKQDKRSPHPYDNDPEEMMRRWQATLSTNEHHARLGALIGTWDVESRMPMHGGGKVAKGTATVRWLVEGRWLMMEQDDSMMGMPMRSYTITGFDNFKLKYVSTTVSSLTTAMLSMEGNFDKDRQNLIQFGPMDEPMTGEHGKCVRYITRFQGPDQFTFEVHDLAIGEGDVKVIEHVYKRRKE